MKTSLLKPPNSWTFLTNHAHVLICLWRDPEVLLKNVAAQIGITERAVQKIVSELEEAKFLSRQRVGRRNSYVIKREMPLRHQIESHCTIGMLLNLIKKREK